MNIVLIQSFSALAAGELQECNAIKFTNFSGYDFSGGNGGTVEYAVGKKDGDEFTPVSNGSCIIPYSVVANWGSDDSVIFNYVITQKGFVAI